MYILPGIKILKQMAFHTYRIYCTVTVYTVINWHYTTVYSGRSRKFCLVGLLACSARIFFFFGGGGGGGFQPPNPPPPPDPPLLLNHIMALYYNHSTGPLNSVQ